MGQYTKIEFNEYDESLGLEANKDRHAVITKEVMNEISEYLSKATAPWTVNISSSSSGEMSGSVTEQEDGKKQLTIKIPEQSKPTYNTITIEPGDWSDNSCTKTVDGITVDSMVSIFEPDNMSNEQALALFDADLQASLGAGSITFTCSGTAPEISITLIIRVEY